MTTDNNLNATETKAPRIRSVSYPSLTISDCIELTNRIYKIFGNITYTTRESLSKQLGISDSHLQTQVSSCVQFGLLELMPKEGYRPAELFIKVRSPMPSENIEEVFINIFSNPELYKGLIEQFNGKLLPQEAGLATVLYRMHKVADKASPLAARIFIQSAIDCGFLKEDGILDVYRNLGGNNNVQIIEEKKGEVKKQEQIIYLPQKIDEHQESDIPPMPFILDNGLIAKLYMPKGATKNDFKRIIKVLSGYVD